MFMFLHFLSQWSSSAFLLIPLSLLMTETPRPPWLCRGPPRDLLACGGKVPEPPAESGTAGLSLKKQEFGGGVGV